jgi:hypothetical protein
MAVVARTINALKAKERRTVSLNGVQPHAQAHSHAGKVGKKSDSDIKR